jgi:hypothetical protein
MREIIKADKSIASVISILVVDGNPGLGFVNCRNVILTGSVKEKLQQYKQATGKEWRGSDEQVCNTPDVSRESISLNLGKQTLAKKLLPCDEEVQRGIDALAAQAKRYLAENEVAKKQPRELQLQFFSKEDEVTA